MKSKKIKRYEKQEKWVSLKSLYILKNITKIFVLSMMMFLFAITTLTQTARGVTITSAATGNWDATGTWVGGVVPGAADIVVIVSAHTVTVTANAACTTLNFGTSSLNPGNLVVNSGYTLTVSGAISIVPQNATSVACTISGAGTITCAAVTVGNTSIIPSANCTTIMTSTINTFTVSGNLTLTPDYSGSFKNNVGFYLNEGILTVNGAITPVTSSLAGMSMAFRMDQGNQTGTLNLGGASPWNNDVDISAPWGSGATTYTVALNGTGATVNYNLAGNQTINRAAASGTLAITYNNLTLSGSGNKSLPATSTATVNGTLSIQGTAAMTTTSPTYGASSTLEYKGSGAQATTAIEFLSGATAPLNLTIDNAAGLTPHAARTLRTGGSANTLTLKNGVLTNSTNNITLNSGATIIRTGGTIAAAPVFTTSTNVMYGDGTYTTAITTGAELPTVTNGTLNNLTINVSGGVTLGAAATLISGGTLAFTNGILDIAGYDLAVTTAANITTPASAKYVKTSGAGQLKLVVAGTTVSFPVGLSAYNPLIIINSGTSDTYGVRVIDAVTSPAANDATKLVNRYWKVTEAVSGNSNLSLTAQWNTGEPNANYAAGTTVKFGYYNTGWVEVSTTESGSNPYNSSGSFNLTGDNLTGGVYFSVGKDDGFIPGTPILFVSTLTGFGNVCTSTTAGPNSFTITGNNLTAADVTVDALSGFTYSTTSGGTYTSSLSLTQGGGAYSQTIYVKFTPTLVQSYNGNIVVGGGGATSVNCAATGSGISSVEPTSEATAINFSSVGLTSMNVNWTNGDGGRRLVLSKQNADVDGFPVDGVSYTANAIFGSGDELVTGNYVVYDGTGSSVTVTNLENGCVYYYAIFEYNNTCSTNDYYLLYWGTGSQATNGGGELGGLDGGFEDQSTSPAENSTSYTSSNNPTDWTKYSLTTATKNATGRSGPTSVTIGTTVAARLRSAPVTSLVSQNTVYTYQFYYKCAGNVDNMEAYLNTSGSTTLGTASSIGTLGTTSGNWVKKTGTVTSTNVAADGYGHFQYRFSGSSGNNIEIDDIAVYEGSSVDNTAPNAPSNQVVDVETYQSLYLTWTAATGGVDGGGYLIVYGTSDPTTAPNTNGIYVEGNIIGTGTVGYVGINNYGTITGLTANTTYYFRVYTFDKAYNYSSAVTCNGTTKTLTSGIDNRFHGSNTDCWRYASGNYDGDDCDCWDVWNGSAWVQATAGTMPQITHNVYIEDWSGVLEYHGDYIYNNLTVTQGARFLWCHIAVASLTIEGDYENAGSFDLVTNENDYGMATTKLHNWKIKGNFKNYGTVVTGRDRDGSASGFYDGQRVPIELGGAGNTTFPGQGTLYLMWDLIINKTNAANTVTFDADVTLRDYYNSGSYSSTLTTSETALKGELYLTNGKLVLGNYDMRLQQYETVNQNASPATNSYVVTNGTDNSKAGYLILQNRNTVADYLFPIGPTTSSYNPVTIRMADASPGDTLFARVETDVSSADGVTNPSVYVDRIWFIEEGTVNGNAYNATFQWEGIHQNSGFDRPTSEVYHNHGSGWNAQTSGAFSGTDPYTKQATGITTFSRWIIGSQEPLPVEIISFKAKCEDDKVHIKWSTASETNNDYFTVEKSKDMQLWEALTTVDGAGNSNAEINYSVIIGNNEGTTYYRLCQTDFDGQHVYYSPVPVNCNDDNVSSVEVSYNTELNSFSYTISASNRDTFNVFLINSLGQTVASSILNVEKGNSLINWDIPSLKSGIYFHKIYNRDNSVMQSMQVFIK